MGLLIGGRMGNGYKKQHKNVKNKEKKQVNYPFTCFFLW